VSVVDLTADNSQLYKKDAFRCWPTSIRKIRQIVIILRGGVPHAWYWNVIFHHWSNSIAIL